MEIRRCDSPVVDLRSKKSNLVLIPKDYDGKPTAIIYLKKPLSDNKPIYGPSVVLHKLIPLCETIKKLQL